jgi:hypothetical protein
MRYWVHVTWTDGHRETHLLSAEEILQAQNGIGVHSVTPASEDEIKAAEAEAEGE